MRLRFMNKGGIVVCLLLFTILISGCGNNKVIVSDDVISQKQLSVEKNPITVMVKYGFSINTLEAEVERLFPQIDLIQVGNYTYNGSPELEKRFEHDDITDIVMTWPLEAGEKYWADRLLDLSGFPFTGQYNISMLDKISRDGKLYYLPGPSELRAIVYNKTLFEENAWELPTGFDEFVELCNTIEQSNIRALQLNFWNKEILDAAFVGFGYRESFSTPENAKKLDDFNQKGEGDFGSFAAGAFESFQRLIDEKIIRSGDLDVRYPYREKMLFTRKCAMVDDTPYLTKRGMELYECTDEFALMPFWSPGVDGDWVQVNPVCYIGLNKKLSEQENQEKYNLVLQIMQYISSPEGQVALAGDSAGMISSVIGFPLPSNPEIAALNSALEHGRYSLFPQLKNAQDALREGLIGMLEGTHTSEDAIKMTNMQNVSIPSPQKPPAVIGTATADFSMIETGNFVTDVMREHAKTDIALFLDNGKDGKYNAKGISAKFYKGDLSAVDVKRILPVLQSGETGDLWKITMTGADLLKTLEYSVDGKGWFYYFSGIRMKYSPTAEPGSRISEITDLDGNKIDYERIYTVAITEGSVSEEYIRSCDKTGVLISDLLEQKIKDKKTITPSGDKRFHIIQK